MVKLEFDLQLLIVLVCYFCLIVIRAIALRFRSKKKMVKCINLLNILQILEVSSINFYFQTKDSFQALIVPTLKKEELANSLSYSIELWPSLYLGVPLIVALVN